MESKVVWRDGMAFDAHLDGSTFVIDAGEEFGGRGLGPKPKGLLLTALVGCTAMDVISILGKMRVDVDNLEVSAAGELASEHPKKFDKIRVTYRVEGKDVDVKKLFRAVDLSNERYCGVHATLKPTVEIENEIILNGSVVDNT